MLNESTQWRKFLQPVVTGLVALMAAGVGSVRRTPAAYALDKLNFYG